MSKPITVAVLVTGRTYPVRAALKKLGATWNPAVGWLVPASRAAEAQALVAGGLVPSQATVAAPEAAAPFLALAADFLA